MDRTRSARKKTKALVAATTASVHRVRNERPCMGSQAARRPQLRAARAGVLGLLGGGRDQRLPGQPLPHVPLQKCSLDQAILEGMEAHQRRDPPGTEDLRSRREERLELM